MGSNLKYMRVSFSSGYDALFTFSIDVGSTYKVDNKFQLGFVARNLKSARLGGKLRRYPCQFPLQFSRVSLPGGDFGA